MIRTAPWKTIQGQKYTQMHTIQEMSQAALGSRLLGLVLIVLLLCGLALDYSVEEAVEKGK